ALALVLSQNVIRLYPEDRLAGLPQRFVYHTEALHAFDERAKLYRSLDYPEMSGGHFPHVDKVEPDLRDCLYYWQNQPSPRTSMGARYPTEIRKAVQLGVIQGGGLFSGHCAVNYRKALATGLEGLQREARDRLARGGLDETGRNFLEAVQIVCGAVIAWAERYATLAEECAVREVDPDQKAKYREIAEICRRVPAKPPRTYREALQSVWFMMRALEIEQGDVTSLGCSLGRIDQCLYPYYAEDLASGRASPRELRELFEEFYLKFHRPYSDAHIMVGGLKEDGSGQDGTNALSYEILDVAQTHKLLIDLGARVHHGSPPAFIRKCAEVSACNIGFSVFGDEASMASLERVGVPRSDAVRYTIVGCVESIIPGVASPRTMEYTINLDKCLELALNDGKCLLTGEQLGPATGAPSTFGDYDAVFQSFAQQVSYFTGLATDMVRIGWEVSPKFVPVPFLSATWDDCIANARDLTEGGARISASVVNDCGISTVADSLSAIKYLVFDRKATDLAGLTEALAKNWQGFDGLREQALGAPKYGNADPYADAIARDVADAHYRALASYRTQDGGRFWRLIFQINANCAIGLSSRTAASPDGRHAQDPIGISLSPSAGQDVRGPYAALDSILSIDQTSIPGGASYIMELNTQHVRDDAAPRKLDLDKIADIIQYFVDHEGLNLAINVLDPEPLREAAGLPGAYAGPAARMYGQSLYFAQMDRRLQDFLIARTDREPAKHRVYTGSATALDNASR
ncbi:MAG TPA: pyruvate formate lyase family protein, partial [Chloroflexota bacterium]|nr:pyruvate formate lyase family protein [Chloroflexota bacterium]